MHRFGMTAGGGPCPQHVGFGICRIGSDATGPLGVRQRHIRTREDGTARAGDRTPTGRTPVGDPTRRGCLPAQGGC